MVNTRQKSYSVIDTHCHVQMSQYDADRDAVIRRALDAGVGLICVGVDLASSRASVALAERYEGIYSSVGLHPNDNLDEAYDDAAYKDIATHPKVVAIGEIGLDYFRTTAPEHRRKQKERFLMQLGLARELNKPVILHCRDAHADMREILARETSGATVVDAGGAQSIRGVVHSFNGTVEDLRAYISYGMCIGMNAIVTYAPSYEAIIREVPSDRLVLETDAPYLAPAPFRGARNEPVHILETARLIAAVRGVTVAELLKTTTANAEVLLYAGVVKNSSKE